MNLNRYRKPPIVEAVVEFRTSETFGAAEMKKAANRFSDDFPLREELNEITFELNPVTGPKSKVSNGGFKLTRFDAQHIVLIRPNGLAASMVAPYPGWDAFISFVQQSWVRWSKQAGSRKIDRVGLRFINRIDIPGDEKDYVPIEEYLCIYPHVPGIKHVGKLNYALQVVLPLDDRGGQAIINTARSPSPLVGHQSIVLDIDAGQNGEIPRDQDQLWDLLVQLRDHKNRLFESYITEKTRGLFE